jgi:hypothetical protein
MLPEIVRAAAEPLSNIDTLTVLSNDGASDVVKNVTRTVSEANATVLGLTGIDIPGLISSAVGSPEPPSGGGGSPRTGGRGTGGGGTGGTGGTGTGGTGTGGTGGTGGGSTGGAPRASSGSGAAAASVSVTAAEPPAIGEAWGARPASEPTPPAAKGRIETPAAADAAMASADAAIRTTTAATAAAAAKTDRAAGPPRPARGARPASADITSETTLDDAALKLASDLRAVPGIERFAAVRLADLESGGPRPLRTMWRISRDQLDQRYGQLTIGELIDRYGGGLTPPA